MLYTVAITLYFIKSLYNSTVSMVMDAIIFVDTNVIYLLIIILSILYISVTRIHSHIRSKQQHRGDTDRELDNHYPGHHWSGHVVKHDSTTQPYHSTVWIKIADHVVVC